MEPIASFKNEQSGEHIHLYHPYFMCFSFYGREARTLVNASRSGDAFDYFGTEEARDYFDVDTGTPRHREATIRSCSGFDVERNA
jgi:hypothetical protein